MTQYADNIFRVRYNGKNNFMTPNIIERKIKDGRVYELSSGDGLSLGSKLFGVTVLNPDGTDSGLNEVFDNETEARSYIDSGFKGEEETA